MKSSITELDDWSSIESVLSNNLQPIQPRANFIIDLRQQLYSENQKTLGRIDKTSLFIKWIVGLLAGMFLMAATLRGLIAFIKWIRLALRSRTQTN